MRIEICPCCGLNSYERYGGDELSPDEGHCFWCGYDYTEHIKHSENKQIKSHKLGYYRRMDKTIKENTDRIINAVEEREKEQENE